VGFVVDKVALRQVFSEYFGFPCQFAFHQLLDNHHLSSGADTIGQAVAAVSGEVCSLAAVSMKATALCDVTPCKLVNRYQLSEHAAAPVFSNCFCEN
jgi:hypothetical protein